MLQQRSLNILKLLMGNKNMTIEGLQTKTELSQRQIRYDIKLINNWLTNNNYSEIIKDTNSHYLFSNNVNDVLKDLAKGNVEYIFNDVERQRIIYLYLFLNYETVSMDHLISLLEVSRGTVNEDLNKLEKKVSQYNISISYTRSKGYRIVGLENDIQYVMMLLIVKIVLFDEENFIFQTIFRKKDVDLFNEFKDSLSDSIQEYMLNFSENNFEIISYIYSFYNIRNEKNNLQNKSLLIDTIENVLEYQVAQTTLEFTDYDNKNEIKFLTSLLLSYSTGNRKSKTEEYFIIKKLIRNVLLKLKKSYAVDLNKENVFEQLYSHIRPALFRMTFRYPMINPIKEEIINQYRYIYIIIKELLEEINLNFKYGVSNDELAYLTIHFATFLRKYTEPENDTLNAVIVCPNGIGISVLLYQELSELFPNIIFLDSTSANKLNKIINNVDLVFSTTLIETNRPLFLVNPIMNNIEKSKLIKDVNRYFLDVKTKDNSNIDTVVNTIEQNADIKNREQLIKDLTHLLSNDENLIIRRSQPMLSELIDIELIQLNITATNWKDAIRKSASPMIETGKITENYIDAMIKNTEENGPYIVITKHVALPHARPEDGAIDVALGVTTLSEPIEFGNENNDPVKYVFSLSAVDNDTHLEALSQLVDLLDDENFYELLDNASQPEEILNYIKENE